MKNGQPGSSKTRNVVDRDAWIGAARRTLIRDGHAAVKVDRLAKDLSVTRGSFYWHFRDRADLMTALLESWKTTNSAAFYGALRQEQRPVDRLRELGRVWLDESDFDPAYDSAVRDWGRSSDAVEAAVRRVDDGRIAELNRLFRDAGYSDPEAFIRARVTYFHQVGYYAMNVREHRAQRDDYLHLYLRVLLGPVADQAD